MPPKKGKKMDLNAFLNDEATGGSWADEMDSLPTGPSGAPSAPGGLGGSHLSQGQNRGGFGDRGMSGGDYGSDRPPRTEVPIPTAPPYTAFVGNLSFEVGEADLQDFFNGMTTTSVRLVNGFDGKPKGFGYVEFTTVDFLKSALDLSGTDLGGRTVRISVAEAPKGREGRADEDMTWVRQGPLAPLAGGRGGAGGFDRPRMGADGGGGGGGFGGPGAGAEDVVRDGPIRGGKFVASANDAPRRPGGFERNVSGGGGPPGGPGGFGGAPRDRDASGVSEAEREGPIRGGKFVAAPERQSFGGGHGGMGERRASGPGEGRADEERTWTRQGPLAPIPGARTGGSFGAPRTGGFGDRTPPSGEVSPQPQRQRLQLSARSSAEASPTASPAQSSRPSPFGAAKPVDTLEREREAEAKLAKEREVVQAKLAAEKELRERDPALAAGVVPAVAKKGASPFGDAKPVDVSQKEKEVEEKLAKAHADAAAKGHKRAESVAAKEGEAPGAASSKSPVVPAASAPVVKASLRKEGFSYSKVAQPEGEAKAVEEVTQKVAESTV